MIKPIPNSKIIFFGTPSVSADILQTIFDAGYEISAVVTNPDAPVGRKHVMTPSPVKILAERLGLPIFQPIKIEQEFIEKLIANGQRLMAVVVAYGKILPQSLIDSFPLGMLNIHYSLLPKYRGASPVESAILNGDEKTGVTIQKLVFKLDAGPIVAVREFPVDNEITTPELKNKLTEMGGELLLETLPKYINGEIMPTEQDESLATHCGKIEKSDGELLPTDSDITKWRKYRAYFGWPGVFYFENDPSNPSGQAKRNKITLAVFENEKFIIKKIIPEGKTEIEV